jgi:quercetin dioxygenase-like cupin family protein
MDMKLGDFIGGWVVGDFEPSLIRTKDIEVAIQSHNAGDEPAPHIHKEADEYNIIITGKVVFNDIGYEKGDICIIRKGEPSFFKAIEDSTLLVIKQPSVIGDKYLI